MRQEEKNTQDVPDIRPKRTPVDELELYGDEQDAPVRKKARPRKSGKKARQTAKRRKKRAAARKRRAKRPSFFEWLVRGTSSRRRSEGIRLFGRVVRFSFWPTFLIIAAALIIGVMFLQGNDIRADEQQMSIVGLPSDLEGYRILHLSDLNGKRFGDNQSTLLREIGTLDYDAVFITGDMVGAGGDPEPFYELLEGLPSSKPVYFISGDSDPGPYVAIPRDITATLEELVYEDWILGAIERGAIYVDQPRTLTVGNSTIWITPSEMLNLRADELNGNTESQMEQEEEGTMQGLEQDYNTLPITTHRYRRARALLDAVNAIQETDVHISLAHIPPSDDFLESSAAHNRSTEKYLTSPTLVLAGHYCGGIWRFPFFGAFYIPNETAPRHGWFPASEDVSGLSAVAESQMYISSGLSTCGDVPLMAFRLFNRPQISVLEFTATLPESMLDQ